jgi:O-antigen biosynthesis protein
VRTSVVVVAYDAWSTLPEALEALRHQVDGVERELILVESSGTESAADLERRWPWVRVIALPERTLPGAARNLAVGIAGGELIAFIDADAIADPEWLDELERVLRPGLDAVAGAIANGTPSSLIGTAGYLLEFLEWLPTRSELPAHAAACNLLLRRDVLERLGGFSPEIWPGEDTILTVGLAASGRLGFARAARVRHLNRTHPLRFVEHQYRLGSSFADVTRRVDFPRGGFGRLPFAPFVGPARVAALYRRLQKWRSLPPSAVALLPLILVGAFSWSAGLSLAQMRHTVRLKSRVPRPSWP